MPEKTTSITWLNCEECHGERPITDTGQEGWYVTFDNEGCSLCNPHGLPVNILPEVVLPFGSSNRAKFLQGQPPEISAKVTRAGLLDHAMSDITEVIQNLGKNLRNKSTSED